MLSNEHVKIIQKDFKEGSWNISSFLIYWHNKEKTIWTFILPLLEDGSLLYIKEFRAWPEKIIISFPVWALEDWLTEIENSRKELEEETWYTSNNIFYLWSSIIENNFEWEAKFYIAKNCYKISEQNLENWENIDVHRASIDSFYKMILEWKVCSSKTAYCFLLAKEKWFFN